MSVRSGRATVGFVLLLLGAALCAPTARGEPWGLPAEPPLTETDYFAFADHVVSGQRLAWDDARGAYVSRANGAAARTNANMLLLHAVAALRHHGGPTRQDDRARRLVNLITHRPMARLMASAWVTPRTVCWSRRLTSGESDHISLDPQVAEALAWAWAARRELRLSPAQAARIPSAIDRCARHAAWRFPQILLNQFNWNAQLYASAAHVTGRRDLLRDDYRRQLLQFASGIERPLPGMQSSNLGPGYQFHYTAHRPASAALNFDTPEYANIVVSGLQYYARARNVGMRPLPAHSIRPMRAWITRLLSGSWTHAGYLNWDTGYGWRRWHSGQYWAFAQQGLLAIATAQPFWARRDYGRWAKAMFDRGLLLYARWAHAGGTVARQLPFGVFSEHRNHDLYTTRIAANAARAIGLGLSDKRATDPPPLYAFDYDTGRLAVTTPRYSTAIVPDNRGAFPYGGIELARLFGPGQRVAANIGGEPPSAFGVVITDRAGHEVLASQHARVRPGELRVTRSPRGRVVHPRPYPSTPLAGRFRTLEVRGTVGRGRLHIATTHRFRPTQIDVRWDVRCAHACGPFTVDVDLPTWGEQAAINVALRDGSRVRLAGPHRDKRDTLRLTDVDHIELGRGRRGGYSVMPTHRVAGAILVPVATSPQPTNPSPGPTLAIRLLSNARLRATSFGVRLRPNGARSRDPA